MARNAAIFVTLLLMLVMITGCGEDEATAPSPPVDEFEVVRPAAPLRPS